MEGISKVTFKKTGMVLRVFKSRRTLRTADTIQSLEQSAANLSEAFSKDMAGYVMVAWDWNGNFQSYVKNDCECKIVTRDLPSWLGEVVRSDVILGDVRRNYLSDASDEEDEPA